MRWIERVTAAWHAGEMGGMPTSCQRPQRALPPPHPRSEFATRCRGALPRTSTTCLRARYRPQQQPAHSLRVFSFAPLFRVFPFADSRFRFASFAPFRVIRDPNAHHPKPQLVSALGPSRKRVRTTDYGH